MNETKGWRLDKLELASAEGISATGLWNPARGAGRTQLEVKADVKDVGKYLERFGYPETVAKGTATLGGTAMGRAGLPDRLRHARGQPGSQGREGAVQGEAGRRPTARRAVAAIPAAADLARFPRRLQRGFAFDSINGSAKIAQGVATTDNLAMTGPAASVAIVAADLAKETQDLTVRVVPVLGDSVAVAAGVALLNPIIAGAPIAQRLFKDPLGQMFSYEYQVTGSWEDPKVVRVRAGTRDAGDRRHDDGRAGERRQAVTGEAVSVGAPFKVAAVQMVSEPSLAANLDAAGALVADAAAKGAARGPARVVLPDGTRRA